MHISDPSAAVRGKLTGPYPTAIRSLPCPPLDATLLFLSVIWENRCLSLKRRTLAQLSTAVGEIGNWGYIGSGAGIIEAV